MTVRGSLTRRIAATTTALFAIAAIATTGAAPVPYTEAGWVDDVYVHASLQADPQAGQNYARAITGYGTLDRPLLAATSYPGAVTAFATANTTSIQEDVDNYNDSAIIASIPTRIATESCARSYPVVGEDCQPPPDPESEFGTPVSYAVGEANALRIWATELWTSDRLVTYGNSDNQDPIRAIAKCRPGKEGETRLTAGGNIILLGNRGGNRESPITGGTHIPVPEANQTEQESTSGWTGLTSYTYTGTLHHRRVVQDNYAMVELRLHVISRGTLTTGRYWTLDLILARAECGTSMQSPNPVPRPSNTGNWVAPGNVGTPVLGRAAPQAPLQSVVEDAADDVDTGVSPTETDPSPSAEADSTSSSPATTSSQRDNSLRTSAPGTTSTAHRTSALTSKAPTVTTAPMSTTTSPTARRATSTSTALTTVIPRDPGTLSATAQTQTVGTVQVDGDALDVVVKGDTVPTGTRTALTALDTWINESIRPSGDWRTFTSSEPDSDGWRWAAINRETGTVVYIR